jgi:adenosine deaminase
MIGMRGSGNLEESTSTIRSIEPLGDVPIAPSIATLPKADLHLHQEERARLDRVVARRRGWLPYDWRAWSRHLLDQIPPGMARLQGIYDPDDTLALDGVTGREPEDIIAKVVDALEEGAADGATLIEIRFGAAGQALLRPDFMPLFREAERRVRERYPRLHAEALGFLPLVADPERLHVAEQQLEACLRLARDGLGGVDFLVTPYDTEADPALWEVAYRWAERAADAGLGITVHAAEFSTANLAAALRVPNLSRLGHAVYAAADARLLEQLARSGVTVECCLSCNVVLGAVESYEAHPIRQFVAAGIPVTLNTDDPVRIWTTIGREYAIAAALGFSPPELLEFTRNAVRASFTSHDRRAVLLDDLRAWEDVYQG